MKTQPSVLFVIPQYASDVCLEAEVSPRSRQPKAAQVLPRPRLYAVMPRLGHHPSSVHVILCTDWKIEARGKDNVFLTWSTMIGLYKRAQLRHLL